MPRKSRMRGTAIVTKRSRNSHIRRRRKVTEDPTGMPSRSRKFEIDLRALVTTAFCPVIMASSSVTDWINLRSRLPSPMPTLTTTLSTRGIWWGLAKPNCSISAGRATFL